MRRVLLCIAAGVLTASWPLVAGAEMLKTYTFTISGSDLMSYVLYDGADGTTAAGNGLYEGARLYTTWDDTNESFGESYASYIDSTNEDFVAWFEGDDRIVDFNLWGYGDRGSNWGEDYKVQDWVDASASDPDWHSYTTPWYWGSPPANNNGELLGWWASESTQTFYSYENGMGSSDGSYGDFTFTMTLDMDDPAFVGTTPWYNGVEGQMVVWFGGWAMNEAGEWVGFYEGNVVVQGQEVPEPASMILFGAGLAGLAYRRRRRGASSR